MTIDKMIRHCYIHHGCHMQHVTISQATQLWWYVVLLMQHNFNAALACATRKALACATRKGKDMNFRKHAMKTKSGSMSWNCKRTWCVNGLFTSNGHA